MSVILLGCKKFDHEELSIQQTCDLCNFAESLSGTYRGQVINNSLPAAFLLGGNNYDSLTITVDHIFPNNDPYSDSLYMYFATSFVLDSVGVVTYDTIQIRSASGKVHNSNLDNYAIFPDSLTIHRTGSFQTGPTYYIPYTITSGTLYKQ